MLVLFAAAQQLWQLCMRSCFATLSMNTMTTLVFAMLVIVCVTVETLGCFLCAAVAALVTFLQVPDTTQPPAGYDIHAEISLEVPVEHGLLIENLLDLAHAPFTHQG